MAQFILLGYVVGALWYTHRQKQAISKLIEQNNLKAELINWITHEGMELDHHEFVEQFMMKANFINMSLHI